MAVTNYLRAIRPDTAPKFGCCFKTKPGEQAQAEFTDEPRGVRKVHLFSFVLGCSRWLWGRFRVGQKLETMLRYHVDASESPYVLRVGMIPKDWQNLKPEC